MSRHFIALWIFILLGSLDLKVHAAECCYEGPACGGIAIAGLINVWAHRDERA